MLFLSSSRTTNAMPHDTEIWYLTSHHPGTTIMRQSYEITRAEEKHFFTQLSKNPWPSPPPAQIVEVTWKDPVHCIQSLKARAVSWCMVTRLLKEHRQHSVAAPPRGNTHNRPPNGTSSALLLFTISANHQNHFLIKTQIEFSNPNRALLTRLEYTSRGADQRTPSVKIASGQHSHTLTPHTSKRAASGFLAPLNSPRGSPTRWIACMCAERQHTASPFFAF